MRASRRRARSSRSALEVLRRAAVDSSASEGPLVAAPLTGRGFAEAAFMRRVGFSRRGELGRRATIKMGSTLPGCAGLLRLRRRRRFDRLGVMSMFVVRRVAGLESGRARSGGSRPSSRCRKFPSCRPGPPSDACPSWARKADHQGGRLRKDADRWPGVHSQFVVDGLVEALPQARRGRDSLGQDPETGSAGREQRAKDGRKALPPTSISTFSMNRSGVVTQKFPGDRAGGLKRPQGGVELGSFRYRWVHSDTGDGGAQESFRANRGLP